MDKRTFHILKRTLTSALVRALLQPMKLMPLKKNRVLFSSYLEKQYSCNPRYISEALEKLYPGKLELVWAFREPEKFAFLKERGIKAVKARSLKMAYYALSSQVICTNSYFKPSLPRRRGQFYLYTWHGGGAYKRGGRFVQMPLIEKIQPRMREGGASLYLSSSKAFTRLTLRESFGYRGEVLEEGMPRNDLLLHPDPALKMEVRKRLGLKDDTHLCLYAPTYRKDTKVHEQGLEYEKVLDALSRRFGGKWVMGYRSHHVTMYKNNARLNEGALCLTEYPDMQELLLISDALITDYSSAIWDAAVGGKRAFLYAPDLSAYQSERDFYTDIHTWPFPLAESMDEMTNNILNFDEDKYAKAVKKHLSELGCCESGRAAYLSARRIGLVTGVEKEK